MKQIKVKELPVDWLVLDHHVKSGNKEFVSFYGDGVFIPKKVFGTKHIQLIAANQEINHLYRGETPINYFIDNNGEELFKGADIDIALGCEIEGKDFFIYKVSEEK